MHDAKTPEKRLNLLICLFLVAGILAVYGQTAHHAFVNYDDELYVTRNESVQAGLTLKSMGWAFTTLDVSNWHPMTWFSHMLACQLFDLYPEGHHLFNLFLHLTSTLLLFHVFRKMTGSSWRSGFVAALFALHPLNVESVAWVSERKGVLCTFFWMLAMWSYIGYVERPKAYRYALIILFFVLGFMAKPMIVTLPFVFLLLDYWPLDRFRPAQHGIDDGSKPRSIDLRPMWEKIPLFVIVALMGVVGFLAQQKGGALSLFEVLPLRERLSNALVSYVLYLWKMIWPGCLAVFYPHRPIPAWQTIGACLFLAGISLLVTVQRKRRPYLTVGWFWYLGTFVPVIQLVQVGLHAMADRYTYIPLVGIFIMVAWGVSDALAKWRLRKPALVTAGLSSLLVLAAISWLQVRHWNDSMALFEHALRCVPNNYVAHNGLARALEVEGKTDEALGHFEEALRIKPSFVDARYNLARFLAAQGRVNKAVRQYAETLRRKPDFVEAHINLANILSENGKMKEAVFHYSEALRIRPGYARAHYNLGNALAKEGKTHEAIREYEEALRIKPDDANTHYNLGNVLSNVGKTEEAIGHYEKALRIRPDFVEARVNLGNTLAGEGRGREAVKQYTEVLRIRPEHAKAHLNLACTLSAQGRLSEALYHFSEALRIQPNDAYTHYQLGNALSKGEKTDEAIHQYGEALRIRPDFAEAHINMGAELAQQGRTDEALRHYHEAITINPGARAYAYYNMACLHAKQHQVDKSIEALKKATQSGFHDWDLIRTDKDLENIRGASDYKDLISDH
ncbi:MAG: tetratricopeptide repeat protein [Deltaproteobacteria bacterium]|nr:tetratricopeptide repeat protein [Deltaproteobacteria bacterium]